MHPQDLENGIRTRDALYEELCEKGTFYINNCDFAELEERMDNLDTRLVGNTVVMVTTSCYGNHQLLW